MTDFLDTAGETVPREDRDAFLDEDVYGEFLDEENEE